MFYAESAWLRRYCTRFSFCFAIAVLLFVPTVTQATVTIIGGNHGPFALNSGPHVIEIMISANAGEGISAIDFGFKINNRIGPAPLVTGIDLNGATDASLGTPLPGGATLFDNATMPSQLFPFPASYSPPGLLIAESVLFVGDAIAPIGENSLLAKVRIDLTGVPAGVYPLSFDIANDIVPVIIFNGVTSPYAPEWVDGTITVVPEPSAWLMATLGIGGIIAVRRRVIRN
ncbi:MAG: PEP-CTERM sorting domain-containing protein [Pirellulales bacterium]